MGSNPGYLIFSTLRHFKGKYILVWDMNLGCKRLGMKPSCVCSLWCREGKAFLKQSLERKAKPNQYRLGWNNYFSYFLPLAFPRIFFGLLLSKKVLKIKRYLEQERIKIRELLQKGFHPGHCTKKHQQCLNRIQNHYKLFSRWISFNLNTK